MFNFCKITLQFRKKYCNFGLGCEKRLILEDMPYTFLDKINTPEDLKKLSINELTTLCQEIREYMIECCAKNPGHLGASLGSVELAVALHYVFNTPEDKIVWDVGHQAYAHKIITGRREQFKKNRTKEGLSGFPKMSESPYDSFGTGHASTSVSAALGMASAAALLGKDRKVVAVVGDGSATGGLVYEGLNNAGVSKADLLVILNDNQIAIDENVGGMHRYLLKIRTSARYNKYKSKIWNYLGAGWIRRHIKILAEGIKHIFFKQGSLFEGFGLRYFGAIDGNNLEALIPLLIKLKNIKGPKLLHVKTVKGKGYAPAEEHQKEWHAPGKFDILSGERIHKEGEPLKYQQVFGKAIVDLANKNPKIVGITPAMLSGGQLCDLMEVYPNRTFDVGIAEEHAVTFSAGLAAGGMLPVCNIYSSFLQRAYDQIIHDVALQNLKVIFTIDRGGLVGEDGATHNGALDLAYLRTIPSITEMAPLNELELRDMLYSATLDQYTGPITIRYPRGCCQGLPIPDGYKFVEKGKGELLTPGKDIAVLSIGTIGNKVQEALQLAKEKGITPAHYNMRFLKPLDTALLEEIANQYKAILTVEDGTIIGGLYGAVCEHLAKIAQNAPEKKLPIIKGLGIPDTFIEQGTVAQQLAECGIDAKGILSAIESLK